MMASAFVALQGYGSDSSEDADSNNEDMNLHLKPVVSDSSSASFSQAISVYSAPAVAIKVLGYQFVVYSLQFISLFHTHFHRIVLSGLIADAVTKTDYHRALY